VVVLQRAVGFTRLSANPVVKTDQHSGEFEVIQEGASAEGRKPWAQIAG